MMTNAISHSLNQHRSPLLKAYFTSGFNSVVACQCIVAIHSDGGDPIAWTTRSDPISTKLLRRGGADGVSVIPTEEDYRAIQSSGEIEGSMGVTFTGSPCKSCVVSLLPKTWPLYHCLAYLYFKIFTTNKKGFHGFNAL